MPKAPRVKSGKKGQEPLATKRVDYKTRSRVFANTSSGMRWYESDREDLQQEIFQHVAHVKQRQLVRRYEMLQFQALYGNFSNLFVTAMWGANQRSPHSYNRLSVNVIKSCVDTATARIAKSKPRVFILPNQGDDRVIRKATNLTKFLDGAMQGSGLYENSELMFRDAAIYGTGYLRIYTDNGQVKTSPVKVDEVIIEYTDGLYDNPQEIHWQTVVGRTELIARYPEYEELINEAKITGWIGDLSYMADLDKVLVVESWRKPSKPGGEDGKHVISICNTILVNEKWEKNYLPIVRFHWTAPTYGPFGQGISLELEGLQASISDMIRNVDRSIHFYAVPRVFVNGQAGLSQHHFNNDISVIKTNGPPQEAVSFLTPSAMSSDVYSYIQWKYDIAYKQIGLSQLTAQSEKPEGLDSGIAMRTYQNIETERFAIVGQSWERKFVEIGKIMIDMAAEMYKSGGKVKVKSTGRSFIETVDWKDASLEEDLYTMQAFPTNLLSNSPEGRLNQVADWIKSGFMPKDVALSQARLPVLNDWIDEETASRDDIRMCISSITEKGIYIEPDYIADLKEAVKMASSAYLRAKYNELAPVKIDLLLRFINRAQELAAPPPPPPAPPGPPPGPDSGAPPVGMGAPPPQAPMAPPGPVSAPTN